MANYKRKAGYKSKRSCGLCKPWKRIGNSRKLTTSKKNMVEDYLCTIDSTL